jgi:hypothetical protein
MQVQTVEFAPTLAHPWSPVVSDVVGKTLELPPDVVVDDMMMQRYLKPHEYRYHGMASGGQLIAFGALETPPIPPTPEPGLHMNLVYLAAVSPVATERLDVEMLRRIEGAATYAGATVIHVQATNEAVFYRGQGYVWGRPGPRTKRLYKPL